MNKTKPTPSLLILALLPYTPPMKCPICSTPTQLYHTHIKRDNQHYYRCPYCHSVAMHQKYYLSREEEKARYLTHNNDVNDPRYQKFVRPVIQAVTSSSNYPHQSSRSRLRLRGRYRSSYYKTATRKGLLNDHL